VNDASLQLNIEALVSLPCFYFPYTSCLPLILNQFLAPSFPDTHCTMILLNNEMRNCTEIVRIGILTASTVFRDITPCSVVDRSSGFGGNYSFLLQTRMEVDCGKVLTIEGREWKGVIWYPCTSLRIVTAKKIMIFNPRT
jgi:hypothetical protein